ncbi:MAG: type II toxin-antitoxin system VapC family toxin [Elusimicrobia bacterium]|nr:type II toxin-antitoxin system VapC family toxin [Elusimicrobiota bacterium]
MIFIDTGAFLGRYLPSDQFHERAAAAWEQLAARRERCLTSNFVLDETLTLLARRADYAFAAERARHIWSSQALEILRPSQRAELEAIDLFEKYADQKVSFTDCVSFALMKESRAKKAFTFDRHFAAAGFETWP